MKESRASDIQTPHDVEIINPDHVICHLSQGGKVDIQLKVETGRGYVPGTVRRYGEEPSKSIGRIVLDASFSPVKRVSYAVESARVEQRTDLDKLVVEIETNGAITAEDAVRALKNGSDTLAAVPAALQDAADALLPLVDRAEKNANFVLSQKQTLTQVSQALREVNSQSSELLDLAEGIATTKIEKGGVTPAEDQGMLDQVNASGAQIVWVGLGSPKQDLWMAQYRARLTPPLLVAFLLFQRQFVQSFMRAGIRSLIPLIMPTANTPTARTASGMPRCRPTATSTSITATPTR